MVPDHSEDVEIVEVSNQHTESATKVFANAVKQMKRRINIPDSVIGIFNTPTEWLDDTTIDIVQGLLCQQFIDIDSLQSVWLLKAAPQQTPLGSPIRRWVQIFNLQGQHWGVASNMHGRGLVIRLCESLFTLSTASRSKKLLKQLAVLSYTWTEHGHLDIEYMDLQRQ